MFKLLRLFEYLLRRYRDAELRQELEHHRTLRQEQLERAGMSTKDAVRASRRALGNVTLAREDAREVWIWPSFERLRQDLRYGVRMLRRQPTFAATAILTLSIGIGATTTVFSVVEYEMWKPLPFDEPHRLVRIYTTSRGLRGQYDRASGPELVDWRARNHVFEELVALGARARRVLRGRNAPESVSVLPVTSNFFATFRRTPALGRAFGPAGDGSSNQEAIVSDACWRRIFASDPEIVGRGITLDDRSYTVVGVLSPARFEFTAVPDFLTVLDLASSPTASLEIWKSSAV